MGEKRGRADSLLIIWMLVYTVFCVGFSLYGDEIRSLYMGKIFGVISCFMGFLLMLLVYLTGKIDVVFGKKHVEQLENGKRLALCCMISFLIGTVIEIAYAVYAVSNYQTNLQKDSMVTSAIICLAVIIGKRAGCRKSTCFMPLF